MKLRFGTKRLEGLYSGTRQQGAYPRDVVEAFFRRIALIKSAVDMRDLRALKGARLEKLRRQRNLYSMRLNLQWRLILEFEEADQGTTVVVKSISKHYGG